MDFSSILAKPSADDFKGHPATILKKVENNGALKVYTDISGHVQRTDIAVPEGRVIIIKDYETVPIYSHYRIVTVLSPQDITLGTLSISPEDRKRPNSMSRFFNGSEMIGTGTGDIGMAIAHELLGVSEGSLQGMRSSIDPNVITSIKAFLQGKK